MIRVVLLVLVTMILQNTGSYSGLSEHSGDDSPTGTESSDNCLTATCPHNSQCVDGICKCLPGFSEENCTEELHTSHIHNACTRQNCNNNGECVISNDHNSSCNCFKGYTGLQCETRLGFKNCTEQFCNSTEDSTNMVVTTVFPTTPDLAPEALQISTSVTVVAYVAGVVSGTALLILFVGVAVFGAHFTCDLPLSSKKTSSESDNMSRTIICDLEEAVGCSTLQDHIEERNMSNSGQMPDTSTEAILSPDTTITSITLEVNTTNPESSSSYTEPSFDMETLYIDHVIMTFDSKGGAYSLEGCDLTIPEGAIPKNKVIAIRIGVSICTQPTSLLPRDVTPVSLIVQLCVMSEPKFKFTKPVTIKIPHFLEIASDDDAKAMNIRFLKSLHNLPFFHCTDGLEIFEAHTHHGTLIIDHFCSFCIAADKTSIDAGNIYYYVMSIIPKQITEPMWDAVFCIVLYTCSRVVEKQFSSAEYKVRKVKMFKFNFHSADPYIEVHFKRELESGWNLALLAGNKIRASEIDYTQIELPALKCLEEDRLYPPRFIVSISGTNAHKTDTLNLNFRGSVQEFTAEIILEPIQNRESQHVYLPQVMQSTNYFYLRGVSLCVSSGTKSLPNMATNKEPVALAMPLFSPTPMGDLTKLNVAPTHLALMNRVAVNIPTKWRDLGLQLGLRTADLELIEARHMGDCSRCFSCVFSTWEKQITRPFTWATILQALMSPLVGEYRLAEEIKCSILQSMASPRSSMRGHSSTSSEDGVVFSGFESSHPTVSCLLDSDQSVSSPHPFPSVSSS